MLALFVPEQLSKTRINKQDRIGRSRNSRLAHCVNEKLQEEIPPRAEAAAAPQAHLEEPWNNKHIRCDVK